MTVLFGLVTAFAWAFANVLTQQVTRTKTKPAVIMFWVLIVTTAAVLPLALIVDHLEGPWTIEGLAWPVAAGVLADVGFFLLLRALRKGSLSVIAPIIALEGGVATICGSDNRSASTDSRVGRLSGANCGSGGGCGGC